MKLGEVHRKFNEFNMKFSKSLPRPKENIKDTFLL